MTGNLHREMRRTSAAHAENVGVEANARVATMMGEFASGMSANSGLATMRGAGVRMALLVSGVLAGVVRLRCAIKPRRRKENRSQPMVSGLLSTARELPRLREMSSGLVARHGLGDLWCVVGAGVATLLKQAGQVLQWGETSEIAHLEPHHRARLESSRSGRPS